MRGAGILLPPPAPQSTSIGPVWSRDAGRIPPHGRRGPAASGQPLPLRTVHGVGRCFPISGPAASCPDKTRPGVASKIPTLRESGGESPSVITGFSQVREYRDKSTLYFSDGDTVAAIDIDPRGPVLTSRRALFSVPRDGGRLDVMPVGEHAIIIRGDPIYSDIVVTQGALARGR